MQKTTQRFSCVKSQARKSDGRGPRAEAGPLGPLHPVPPTPGRTLRRARFPLAPWRGREHVPACPSTLLALRQPLPCRASCVDRRTCSALARVTARCISGRGPSCFAQRRDRHVRTRTVEICTGVCRFAAVRSAQAAQYCGSGSCWRRQRAARGDRGRGSAAAVSTSDFFFCYLNSVRIIGAESSTAPLFGTSLCKGLRILRHCC